MGHVALEGVDGDVKIYTRPPIAIRVPTRPKPWEFGTRAQDFENDLLDDLVN